MSIKIRFDSNNKPIEPTIVLATRAGKLLGALPAVNLKTKDGIKDNKISYSELSFNVYKSKIDPQFWKEIKDFRLVWVKDWNRFYEITVETFEADNEIRKFVSAKSLGEAELSRITLYDIQINTSEDISRDDYEPTTLYNAEKPETSLLHRITEKTPHYQNFNIVDNSESIAKIQRTFTFDGKDIYSSLSEIAEEVGCIFCVECSYVNGKINRQINVYNTEEFGEMTPIIISTENLAENIDYKKNSESIVNCYKLEAGDDLMNATIVNCNPNGTAYLWNFTEDEKKDMSDELRSKISEYDSLYSKYTNRGDKQYYMFSKLIELDVGLPAVFWAFIIVIGTEKINTIINKYTAGFYSLYTAPEFPEISKYPYTKDENIDTWYSEYSDLSQKLYETISLQLYLEHNLMPKPAIVESTAEDEATKLNNNLKEVSVQSIEQASKWSVTDAILKMARIIIDSTRYEVSVSSGEYNAANKEWTGSLTVTRKTDSTESKETESLSVTVSDNPTEFVKQQIDFELGKAVDDISAVALFKKDDNAFAEELKKYSLSRLQAFRDSGIGCIDIIDQKSDTTWASGDDAKSIRKNYNNKLDLLTSEIETRESEINVCKVAYSLLLKESKLIQKELNLKSYLGDLWLELSAFRRESSFSNQNYISDGLSDAELFKAAKEFFDMAKKEIQNLEDESHTISADINNLLAMKEFAPIVDYFKLGNQIRLKSDGRIFILRLSEYGVDYDNLDKLETTFTDTKLCSASPDIIKHSGYVADLKKAISQISKIIGNLSSIFNKIGR